MLLQVVTNRITTLAPPPSDVFQHLDSLDLDSNPIEDWAEIMKLSALPKYVNGDVYISRSCSSNR